MVKERKCHFHERSKQKCEVVGTLNGTFPPRRETKSDLIIIFAVINRNAVSDTGPGCPMVSLQAVPLDASEVPGKGLPVCTERQS